MSSSHSLKNPVRLSFNRAASTYAATASLQRRIADLLITQLHQVLAPDFSGRILDAGCGTGYCIDRLHQLFPSAEIIGLDFAEDMLRHLALKDQHLSINAQIEQLPLATGSIDCYVSNLAWQWCDPDTAARESHRVLHQQGQLIITTLSTDTFYELANCLKQLDLSPQDHLLKLITPDNLIDAFERTGWHVIDIQRSKHTTWHRDFHTLRHSIRGVGANHRAIQNTIVLNRAQHSALIADYETLRTPQGLPLSYDVVTLRALKA